MTCPNCYCTTCQAERAKWTAPPVPHPYTFVTPLPAGHWRCGCGCTHPPGHVCSMMGVTQNASPK